MGASAVALSGCGWEWPEYEPFKRDPLAFLGNGSKSDENVPPPPLVIPQDAPDQNDPQSTLMPASTMGLNLQTYFAQKDISDPDQRIQRLENALIAVHQDMKRMMAGQNLPLYENTEPTAAAPVPVAPVMAPVIDEDDDEPQIQQQAMPMANESATDDADRVLLASGGPQSLTTSDTTTPPQPPREVAPAKPPSTPVYENTAPKPAPTAPAAANTPAATGPTAVTGLRVGEHKDKIRIVLDVSRKTLYTADLDNNENLLVIELPDAGWNDAKTKDFGKMPLLKSYRVDPFNDNKGNIVVIQLKGSSSILNQSQIPALSGGGQRIFIDLAR